MKTQDTTVFTSDPSPVLLKGLNLRLAEEQDYERADALFGQQHYLGAAKRSGRGLLQIIEYEGRWVALLDWGPAALKLADRDDWIGWNGRQRADRRELVVQNRRFLVLSATRMPNLASRCLSLGLKQLSSHWKQRHGFAPLLAETFTDIEQFEGTCYKAANWQPCGHTKGFARHRADYYVKHGRPKKLWLYPLHTYCREILQGIELPGAYAPARNAQSPERDLPLKKVQLDSLRECFKDVVDPRAANRQFRVSSLLTLIALALLAGRKSLAEIQRYGQFLNHTQRVWLDWPRNKTGTGRKAPSYSALYNLLRQLDPHAFAEVLSRWMQAHYGKLPRALALDGKYIRDQVLTLCLSEHQSGAPHRSHRGRTGSRPLPDHGQQDLRERRQAARSHQAFLYQQPLSSQHVRETLRSTHTRPLGRMRNQKPLDSRSPLGRRQNTLQKLESQRQPRLGPMRPH